MKPINNNKSKQVFALTFLIITILLISMSTVFAQNNTDINQTNATIDIIKAVDTAVAMSTEIDFIRTISNKIFLPSVVAYWLMQFIIILLIGLLTVSNDKDTYFIIFIVTQLIGALMLFFIFILPIIPQLINNLMALL